MIRYYFFNLLQKVVGCAKADKKLQAFLIVAGGIAAFIFMPYLSGTIAGLLMGTTDSVMVTWEFGAMTVILGVIVFGALFAIYKAVLSKLEEGSKKC